MQLWSTVIDLDKVLAIYVQYTLMDPRTKKLRAITKILSVVHVDDGAGETVHVKARWCDYMFEELELDRNRMYTFASDGASAMVGEGTGVVGRFTREENPFLVVVHCAITSIPTSVVPPIARNGGEKCVRRLKILGPSWCTAAKLVGCRVMVQ